MQALDQKPLRQQGADGEKPSIFTEGFDNKARRYGSIQKGSAIVEAGANRVKPNALARVKLTLPRASLHNGRTEGE